jgi:DUF971 family protein
MLPSSQPVEITRDAGDRRMLVRWADGHVSYYPWRALRFACPCAWCQGEWGQPGALAGTSPDDLSEQQVTMTDVELVGRYALQPTWADGHATGIYAFRMLRQLCPCGPWGSTLAS